MAVPPKFPVPSKLAFLLRLGTFPATVKDIVGEDECENAKQMVVTTLTVRIPSLLSVCGPDHS